MTTIAIAVGSVFAYVVVAGRAFRLFSVKCPHWDEDAHYAAGVFWPVVLAALAAVGVAGCMALVMAYPLRFVWNLGATPRRRSKLPKARVRR